jgi:hypothetical protein
MPFAMVMTMEQTLPPELNRDETSMPDRCAPGFLPDQGLEQGADLFL